MSETSELGSSASDELSPRVHSGAHKLPVSPRAPLAAIACFTAQLPWRAEPENGEDDYELLRLRDPETQTETPPS